LQDHFIDRAYLLDRQAGVNRRQNAFVVFGVEPVIGLHRHDRRAQLARNAHQVAGLDAERLGRVARGDRYAGIRQGLHDNNGLPAQGRVFLLLARRKKGVEIEEQPLHRILGRLHVHLLFYTIRGRNPQGRCRRATPSASRTCVSSTWCARAATPAGTRRPSRTRAAAGPARLHAPDVA
jgi:hypothetical protein